MKHIATALLTAQQGLDPIHKGKKGYGYSYADLAAVLSELTEALNKVGVVIIQSPAKSDKQAACVVTRLIHAESGEEIVSEIEVPWASSKNMNDAQAYGSAITYAKRYALVSMMGVVTEDDDGAKAAPKREPAPPTETPARKKFREWASKAIATIAPMHFEERAVWLMTGDNTDRIKWAKVEMADVYAEFKSLGIEV